MQHYAVYQEKFRAFPPNLTPIYNPGRRQATTALRLSHASAESLAALLHPLYNAAQLNGALRPRPNRFSQRVTSNK